jgi:hypothetical protein
MKLALLVVVVAACGSKSDAPPATGSGSGSAKQSVAVAVDAGTPAKAKTAAHKVTPPTKQQIADYRKHVKAGWALQKASKWAEAIPEFEQALVAIDGDQRALTELGFSAMNAGDFAKARRADEQAIQVAADKKVKAMALYNLGLVQEKTNDKAGALRSYVASLALRPNKTVERAVGRLGTLPEATPPFCAKGAKPCDCALAYGFDDDFQNPDNPPTCEEAKDIAVPVPGFHVYKIARVFHMEDWSYLLDEHDQYVATVKGFYMYRGGRVSDDLELDSATVQTISGHKLLRIQTHDRHEETEVGETDDDMKILADETTVVTICEIGIANTRCPLRDVPIAESHEGNSKTDTTLDLSIAADGTATLKLVSGPTDDAIDKLVGPHKLW